LEEAQMEKNLLCRTEAIKALLAYIKSATSLSSEAIVLVYSTLEATPVQEGELY
jgi:hypothetical protein